MHTSWSLQYVSEESCFPDCWKVSLVVPEFKKVGERCMAKSYRPVSLLSVVIKVFQRLVDNRLANHLEKCDLFSDFQLILGLLEQLQILWKLYLIELLGLLIGWGLLKLKHLIYQRLSTGIGMLVFFKLKWYRISGQIFDFIWPFISNRQLQVVLDGKFSQEYRVNSGVSILGLHFSCYTLT